MIDAGPSPDLPVVLDPSLEKIAQDLLNRIGVPGQLPAWPTEEMQTKYAASHGIELMRTTVRFVETLERVGAFENPSWRGLDYGCGWGRIASVMLSKGGPDQLDLCDAWPQTIDLLEKAGFSNKIFATSEVVKVGEIAESAYDFIYSYSVFTHLRRDAFENNLDMLARGLKPSGKLFITVRHADYMSVPRARARNADLKTLSREGFWYRPFGNREYFGTAVTDRRYLEALPIVRSLRYLGKFDGRQHLYVIDA